MEYTVWVVVMIVLFVTLLWAVQQGYFEIMEHFLKDLLEKTE